MKRFDSPDCLYIDAAEGWLELGDYSAASRELDRVSPKRQRRPRVLELRWQVSAATHEWKRCLSIASSIVRIAPKRTSGWVCRSKALYGLKRVREARDNLLEAEKRKVGYTSEMLYELARYECLLGNLESAKRRLEGAPHWCDELGEKALRDSDFRPLWPTILEMQVPF